MRPAARIAAAADILDVVLAGEAAEKTLTGWARRNRYAGSGDRAAIRDLVFKALRCRRSFAWLGGADTGRGLMLGSLRTEGVAPETMFTGEGYAPLPLTTAEAEPRDLTDALLPVRLNMPDWLMPELQRSLGDDTDTVCLALAQRAPVFLRVNLLRSDVATAVASLANEGIEASPHPLSPTALQVTGGARRVHVAQAYRDGLVELQDAASQAVVDALPAVGRVLDYCAGGGGKSLALAARGVSGIVAHDADPGRMRDLSQRAARAGAAIDLVETQDLGQHGPFDLVLCDAPCSGSGAWRRSPDAKWRLTPDGLQGLLQTQAEILERAQSLVAPGGTLAYVTCSVMDCENREQIAGFLGRNSGWRCTFERQFSPLDAGDGFYSCHLTGSTDQS